MVNGPDGELLVTALGKLNSPTGLVFRLVDGDEEFSSDAIELASNAGAAVKISETEAKSLYNTNCARCHGPEGAADGPDSDKLGAWVPSFQSPEFHQWRSDDEILVAIREGGAAVGQSPAMPPWKSILSEAEIVALKDYVRSFKP